MAHCIKAYQACAIQHLSALLFPVWVQESCQASSDACPWTITLKGLLNMRKAYRLVEVHMGSVHY